MISALCLMLSAALSFSPAPGDIAVAEMILRQTAMDGQVQRSDTIADRGQCKRFQHEIFAQVAPGYRLSGHPEVALYLPLEHASVEESGRAIGTCWTMPPAEAGNAFVEAARYDYDRDLTPRENEQGARAFLEGVRAGDIVQMLARYNNGVRGTHTVMITQPYDPREGVLYWSDSNFANTQVDGVRYGTVRAFQAWPIDEVAGWLSADRGNGATIYRLSPDIVRAEDAQIE